VQPGLCNIWTIIAKIKLGSKANPLAMAYFRSGIMRIKIRMYAVIVILLEKVKPGRCWLIKHNIEPENRTGDLH